MVNSYCGIPRMNVTRSSSEATKNLMYPILVSNIAFSAFLCYTTIMMNVVTIYALMKMMKTSLLSRPLKTLLLSLAVSDLGVGIIGFPFQITFLVGQIRCKISNGADTNIAFRVSNAVVTTLFMSSLSTIVALSVDRFIAIEMPLRYDDIMSHKRIVGVITVIWLVSVTFSTVCYMFKAVPVFSAFVLLVIMDSVSFLITTVTSCKIYVTLRRHKKEMENGRQQYQQSAANRVSRSESEKSANGTLLIYLFFWVCYLPHLVISIVRAIYAKPNTFIEGIFVFSETLVFFNSSINPVIFCWKMTPIRRIILSILRNTFLKYHLHESVYY